MQAETIAATATKSAATFTMSCEISCVIHASAEAIWALLTDAEKMPSWNSTVTSVGGKIALGETLELRVPAAPKRVFKPKVTRFEPSRSMEWSDGFAPMFKGVRTFTLSPNGDGSVTFRMKEVFTGMMLPMIKGSLPDFAPAFEAYAADLKRAAERKS
jgi:hypothetical protein